MRELVITNKGKELMAKLIAGTTTITFTKIKTTAEDLGSNLETLTDFTTPKQEAVISSVTKTDFAVVEVLSMLNNQNLNDGYYIKAVGLFAKEADNTEVLYGVSLAGDHPDYMPAYGGKTLSTITYKLITKVDNSDNVTIEINPSALPTITQVNEIREVAIKSKELVEQHTKTSVLSGMHDFKFDKTANKFQYKENDAWHDIDTAGAVNTHANKSVISGEGAHDLKYDTAQNKFKYKQGSTWHDIDTGAGATAELNTHKGTSITGADGVHNLKFDTASNKFQYKNGSSWTPIEIQSSHIDAHANKSVLDAEGAHNLKYDKNAHKFKYKEGTTWHDIDTGAGATAELNTHKGTSITGADGVHNLKFDTASSKFHYKNGTNWTPIEVQSTHLDAHTTAKISGDEGVHGIRYEEREDALIITKSNGSTGTFKPGVDPDQLFNDLNTGLDNCITKVGNRNG